MLRGTWTVVVVSLCSLGLLSKAELPPDLPPLPVEEGAQGRTPASISRPVRVQGIPVAEPYREDGASTTPQPIRDPIAPKAEPYQPVPSPPAAGTPAGDQMQLPMQSREPVDYNRTQVAILGYHDFSMTKKPTDMRINTEEFRVQMQALVACNMPLITMRELLAWKRGELKLPEHCVLITIDDGWDSVYNEAYPILRQFNIPFTIFPYTQFLSGNGASMEAGQIKEMMLNGATVGSHSTSHLYPVSWRSAIRKGVQEVDKLLQREIKDSRQKLVALFGDSVNTYCYPGGFVIDEMLAKLEEYGYVAAFTVVGRKVMHNDDVYQLPRYMVYGKSPQTFMNAVSFVDKAQLGDKASVSNAPPPQQSVMPMAGSTVRGELPSISISFAGEDMPVDLKSLQMGVSGFGRVPAIYNPDTKTLTWEANRPFYLPVVTVEVKWKYESGAPARAKWQFKIEPTVSNFDPEDLVE